LETTDHQIDLEIETASSELSVFYSRNFIRIFPNQVMHVLQLLLWLR
jgi:hypothetical protein